MNKTDLKVNKFSSQLAEKAAITDNARTTTDKTVTGAINEINTNKAEKTELTTTLTESKSYTDDKVATVASGTPDKTFTTLADLNAAYPTGDSKNKLLSSDGHIYNWNGSAWTDTGIQYQSTGIANKSVINLMLEKQYSNALVENQTISNKSTVLSDVIDDSDITFSFDNPSATTISTVVCGKNLLPMQVNKVYGGITLTVSIDGTITLNGTAGGTCDFVILAYLPIGTYTWSLNNASIGDVTFIARNASSANIVTLGCGSATNATYTNTIASDMTYYVIRVASGAVLSNFTLQLQAEKGSTVTAYEPFKGSYQSTTGTNITAIAIKGDNNIFCSASNFTVSYYKDLNTKMSELDALITNSLNGLVWDVIGDSISAGGIANVSYYDYIKNETGIIIEKLAVSGSGYKKVANSSTFIAQALQINPNGKYVTIFGSINDIDYMGDSSLGTPTDSTIDTLAGCINIAINNVYSTNPSARLGIISPIPQGSFNGNPQNTNGLVTAFVSVLEQICKLRGIPFLDLFHSSGLRPWDTTFADLYFYSEDAVKTHPTSDGHKLFYPTIREFIISL